MNLFGNVRYTAAIGAVTLTAFLTYWYFRQRYESKRANIARSRSILKINGEVAQDEMDSESAINQDAQRMETEENLSASEKSSHEPISISTRSNEIPHGYSEKAVHYMATQPCLPQVQTHETRNENESSSGNRAKCSDVQQKDSEAENNKSETAEQDECDHRISVKSLLNFLVDTVATMIFLVKFTEAIVGDETKRVLEETLTESTIAAVNSEEADRIGRLRRMAKSKELSTKAEKELYIPEGQKNSKPQVVTKHTVKEKREAREVELSILDSINWTEISEEEYLPGKAILELACKVALNGKQKESTCDFLQETFPNSFVSAICCQMNSWHASQKLGIKENLKSYADAFAEIKIAKLALTSRSALKDVVSTNLLYAQTCYYMSRQYKKDSLVRKRFITEGYFAANCANRMHENFKALKWVIILSTERLYYLKNRAKYEEFLTINAMLQKVNNLLSLDDFLNYFRGRMLYEYVCYSTREMTGGLLNQPILLKTAISCIEEACYTSYPAVFIESLYYLACCFILQGEKEKAKKLLPLTERVYPYDQAEVEYLHEMKKLFQ